MSTERTGGHGHQLLIRRGNSRGFHGLLLVLLLSLEPLSAQWISDPALDAKILQGIEFIYSIEFDKADREFADVVRSQPDHPAGYFFQAMTQWWRILSDFEDESQDERFVSMLANVEEVCERRLGKNKNDVAALFFKGGAIGFRGRLRVNRGKWLAAANDGVSALSAIRKANELEPKNSDILLGMGIYNYYAEMVPDQYPILKPVMLFLPGGDKKKGLEQLERAAQEARYAKIEAMYFLLQTYFSYEKNYTKSLELASRLRSRYPKNSIFHRMYGRCFVSLGNWNEVQRVFGEVEERFRTGQPGYNTHDGREAHYYLGRYHFISGNLNEALQHFFRCDELSRRTDKDGASGFMSMTNLTIGMIYDLQGRRSSAQAQYQKVLLMKEYNRTHSDARRFIKTPYKR